MNSEKPIYKTTFKEYINSSYNLSTEKRSSPYTIRELKEIFESGINLVNKYRKIFEEEGLKLDWTKLDKAVTKMINRAYIKYPNKKEVNSEEIATLPGISNDRLVKPCFRLELDHYYDNTFTITLICVAPRMITRWYPSISFLWTREIVANTMNSELIEILNSKNFDFLIRDELFLRYNPTLLDRTKINDLYLRNIIIPSIKYYKDDPDITKDISPEMFDNLSIFGVDRRIIIQCKLRCKLDIDPDELKGEDIISLL